jgi:hypothetical protein
MIRPYGKLFFINIQLWFGGRRMSQSGKHFSHFFGAIPEYANRCNFLAAVSDVVIL